MNTEETIKELNKMFKWIYDIQLECDYWKSREFYRWVKYIVQNTYDEHIIYAMTVAFPPNIIGSKKFKRRAVTYINGVFEILAIEKPPI